MKITYLNNCKPLNQHQIANIEQIGKAYDKLHDIFVESNHIGHIATIVTNKYAVNPGQTARLKMEQLNLFSSLNLRWLETFTDKLVIGI
ncbi:hypothetical protein [Aliikangiella coralliicola]|uniref:Uncharacterized protein n=1 Tax=Aliikangiella coralliicola TaxID=2592383 RepID=A0A545U012_9GAMM|nr:hypothetical protein [Aliikangiella coralliicola]TQV82801.1 hypothetical protein FLL46_23820 [Aliikangiella coralliicola]